MKSILFVLLFVFIFSLIAASYTFSLVFGLCINLGCWSLVATLIIYLCIKYKKRNENE